MDSTTSIFSSILAVLVLIGCFENSWQYVTNPTCYEQPCPADTTSCKRELSSNIDKTRLKTKISCLDDSMASLKQYEFEEAAHLNPHTIYQSTSYQTIDSPQQSLDQRNRYAYPHYDSNYYRGLENFL